MLPHSAGAAIASELPPSGDRLCCNGGRRMLPADDGVAANRGQMCYQGQAVLDASVGRRCCQRMAALLPAAAGDSTSGNRMFY